MGSKAFIGFQTILVAYDGSLQAEHALDIAFSLAKTTHAKIEILAVVRPPEPALRAELHAILEEAQEHYAQSFAAIEERAKQNQIEVQTDLAVGNPADQIIHRAEKIQASLIVMGKRGRSVIERWVLGSNSERVLRYAHCPVMVVH
jgi:nucleotide-binding universal stress UspA family protein